MGVLLLCQPRLSLWVVAGHTCLVLIVLTFGWWRSWRRPSTHRIDLYLRLVCWVTGTQHNDYTYDQDGWHFADGNHSSTLTFALGGGRCTPVSLIVLLWVVMGLVPVIYSPYQLSLTTELVSDLPDAGITQTRWTDSREEGEAPLTCRTV